MVAHPMTIDLDTRDIYQRLDPDRMIDHILNLPRQVEDAWQALAGLELPDDCRNPDSVVLLGMGGSAIGGDLVADYVAHECPAPFIVNRGYDLPAWVGPRTLVIASSYSGNTEETLSGAAQALARGAPVVGVSSGGELTARLRAAGRPVVPIHYRSQPRAALGHSLIPVLGILHAAGLIDDPAPAIGAAAAALAAEAARNEPNVPTAANPAKSLALDLVGRIPVVYGAEFLSAVARRWKTQINENAKSWGIYEEFPELNHNAVLGYQFPGDLKCLYVVQLDSPLLSKRVRARYAVTRELLTREGVSFTTLTTEGDGRLAQMLGAIVLGDFVSYYLAMLYEVDPTPVTAIDFLKAQLARL